jgi:hypothetical protein
MISSVIVNITSSVISSVPASATDATGDIDTANLLYEDNDGLVNALYQDNDGTGKALFEETI